MGVAFRAQLLITSWIQEGAETERRVKKREETIESEWRFLWDLVPKLQQIVRFVFSTKSHDFYANKMMFYNDKVADAEKHFIIGTMTLTQALLRDVRFDLDMMNDSRIGNQAAVL